MSENMKVPGMREIDAIMSAQQFCRRVSAEPQEGYVWKDFEQRYEESDATFRARILGTLNAGSEVETKKMTDRELLEPRTV